MNVGTKYRETNHDALPVSFSFHPTKLRNEQYPRNSVIVESRAENVRDY
jgi:hypothetical protein